MSGQARTVAHTLVTSMVKFVIGGVMTVLTARMLGPDGRGAYAVLLTIAATAVSLGHLSIDTSHSSLWEQSRHRAAIGTNALFFGLGLGVVSAALCALVVTTFGARLVPLPGYDLLALALLTIPCSMTVYYLNSVLVLRARVEVVNWSGVLGVSVPCALLLVFGVLGETTLTVVVVAWVMSAVVPMVLVIGAVRPRLGDLDLTLARRTLGMGLLHHVGGTSFFLLLRIDILLLNARSTAATVGLYALAVTLMEWTRMAGDAIAQAVLPRQLTGDSESAGELTARVTRLSALVSAVSVAAVCLAAPLLIPVVFGAEFRGSLVPVFGLAPGIIALSVARVVGAFLLRLHRPLLRSSVVVGALVVNVALNLALIPSHGILGCAIASSVGYSLLAGGYLVWFSRETRVPMRRLLPGREEIHYLRSVGARLRPSRARLTVM